MVYSVVEIKGGFGNQLFQFNYAHFLKSRRHKVLTNTHWFKENNDKFGRNLIFDSTFYKFKNPNKYLLKTIEINQKYKFKNNLIYSVNSDESVCNKNSLIKHYNGYWQSKEYLENTKNFLKPTLSQHKGFEEAFKKDKKSSVMIHIRSKDYKDEILETEYFNYSVDLLSRKFNDLSFNLFTDDEEILSSLNFKRKLNSVNIQSSSEDDTLFTFIKMLENEHFIISNSTFSFMAALLGSENSSIVIQPSPWMKKKNKNLTIKDWVSVSRPR
tara:strand:+ start:1054 stop:1863 length:810 start_codon:yes stop_codon:yes gene_type:complete